MNPTTTGSPLDYELPPAAPAMGRFALERHADGSVTITAPSDEPLGRLRPLRALYAVLPVGIVVSMVVGAVASTPTRLGLGPVRVTASVGTFWALGFALALALTCVLARLVARARRQRLVIHADATQLIARHESARTGEQLALRWPRDQIRELHTADGIRVVTTDGKRHTVHVPGRDAEREWLARTLREALGLGTGGE